MVNIEKHENRFADIERREGCGWDVGARAGRPRGGWKAENKPEKGPDPASSGRKWRLVFGTP